MTTTIEYNGLTYKSFKGGQGYEVFIIPGHRLARLDSRVLAHHVIWEIANKASLLKNANVHHVNGIRDDNRPENLQAMTRSQHTILTHKGQKRSAIVKQNISNGMNGLPLVRT